MSPRDRRRYTGMNRLLDTKTAVIYGAGGGLGSGVARTFAAEGAHVVLTGRTREPLERVAEAIDADGASCEVAVVDALDEEAVDAHLDTLHRVDVSFNLVTRGDVHGHALTDLSTEAFMRPVLNGLRSNFLTARAAARRMTAQGSGVILTVTSGSSAGQLAGMGGTGPADAATESFLRCLSAEVGPQGVRVCGIWTAGVPETFTHRAEAGDTGAPTAEEVDRMIGSMATLRRAPRLQQVADAAAFLASDRAAGTTGSIANVTCGLVQQR
jgi:NAD(P)-dependent dehydrogenase (short-subunit alcohol dehydrogenase family)